MKFYPDIEISLNFYLNRNEWDVVSSNLSVWGIVLLQILRNLLPPHTAINNENWSQFKSILCCNDAHYGLNLWSTVTHIRIYDKIVNKLRKNSNIRYILVVNFLDNHLFGLSTITRWKITHWYYCSKQFNVFELSF